MKNNVINNLKNFSNVKIVSNTTCFAYFHYNLLLAIQDLDPEILKLDLYGNFASIIGKLDFVRNKLKIPKFPWL